jgi:hypothetical protein
LHRRLAGFDDMLEPAHGRSRIVRHDLADHQTLENHGHGGELLFDRLCNDNSDVRSATIRLAGLVIADGGRHGPKTISGDD